MEEIHLKQKANSVGLWCFYGMKKPQVGGYSHVEIHTHYQIGHCQTKLAIINQFIFRATVQMGPTDLTQNFS